MSRDVRLLVPQKDASIARDTETRFYELEDWFVEQLLGILPFLGQLEFWTGTDEEIITAAGHAEDQIYQLIRGTDVLPEDLEFRLNGVNLEYRKSEADDWISVGGVKGDAGEQGEQGETGLAGADGLAGTDGADGATGATGADGTDGSNGADGSDGIDGEDCDCEAARILETKYIEEPSDLGKTDDIDGYNAICGGVKGLLDYAVGKYNLHLNKLQAVTNGEFAIADAVIALATLGSYQITPVDDIINLWHRMVDFGFASAHAQVDSVENLDMWRCSLYCLIKAAEGRALTEAIYDEWVDTIETNAEHPLRAFFDSVINYVDLANRYYAYSYTPDGSCEYVCEDCGDGWEYLFDFAANGQQGWDLYSFTTFETGVGFHSFHSTNNAGGSYNAGEELGTTLIGFTTAFITDAILYVTVQPLANVSAHNAQVDGVINENALVEGELQIEFSINAAVTNLFIYTIANNTHPSAFQPTGAEQTVTAILIRGTGFNPFI